MKKHIPTWQVTAEISMGVSRYKTVIVKASTERKARILAEKKLISNGVFYVTNMLVEEIKEEEEDK